MTDFAIETTGARTVLRGRLTASARPELSALLGRLSGTVSLDLSGIDRISSDGAREWLRFIRDVPPGVRVVLERCSVPFVAQLNMIHGFAGAATVASVQAPYFCESCQQASERLVELEGGPPRVLPSSPCRCGGTAEADVLDEQYFYFLRSPRP